MSFADPIVRLPPELTLRILEFAPISSLANLTAVSKAWHNFIDVTHQEAIYSKRTGTTGPHGSEDMTKVSSYSQYLESAESSKSLCQRQALLSRSWRSDRPMTTQTVLEPGGGGYFQFRADFTRRFFISTSEKGELNVTDMESATLLWSLPSTLVSNVDSEQPCGLLEYEDGVAVFARDDNVLEVWQTDAGVLRRGEFRRWAVLPHEEEIWDAHLFGGVLRCVLSTGESLVYDLRRQAPKLTQRIQIAERDITYMCQDAKVVVYSMGRLGLYVHDQQSGELLGILKPGPEVSRYHILRPCHIRVRYQKYAMPSSPARTATRQTRPYHRCGRPTAKVQPRRRNNLGRRPMVCLRAGREPDGLSLDHRVRVHLPGLATSRRRPTPTQRCHRVPGRQLQVRFSKFVVGEEPSYRVRKSRLDLCCCAGRRGSSPAPICPVQRSKLEDLALIRVPCERMGWQRRPYKLHSAVQ